MPYYLHKSRTIPIFNTDVLGLILDENVDEIFYKWCGTKVAHCSYSVYVTVGMNVEK